MEIKTITLGELRSELQSLLDMPNDTKVTFGAGDLSFRRMKDRGPIEGPAVMNMEFYEIYRVTMPAD